MKRKIEINHIDIVNYLYMEDYLKNMSKKGWLLKEIVAGVFFIYEKIEPQEIEFKISPSPMKKDNWIFLTGVSDFYIYHSYELKEEEKEIINYKLGIPFMKKRISDGDLELLQNISGKRLKGNYILFLIALAVTAFVHMTFLLKEVGLVNRIVQSTYMIFLIYTLLFFMEYFYIKKSRFIHEESTEVKKELNDLNQKRYKGFKLLAYGLLFIFFNLLIYDILFNLFIIKRYSLLLLLIPIVLYFILVYKYFKTNIAVASEKDEYRYFIVKRIGFLEIIFIAISIFFCINSKITDIDLIEEKYYIVSEKDFNRDIDGETYLIKRNSYFFPNSYYFTTNIDNKKVEINYLKSIKDTMVFRRKYTEYIVAEREEEIRERYSERVKEIMKEYQGEELGKILTSEFNLHPKYYNMIENYNYDEKVNTTIDTIIRSIINHGNRAFWEVDSITFLNEDKSEALIELDKDVFRLNGFNYFDEETIEIIKNKFNFDERRTFMYLKGSE